VHWSTGSNARCVVLAAGLQAEHERVARAAAARAESILVMSPGSETFDSLIDLTGQGTAGRRGR
jgi:hypothetical protein